MNLLVIGANGMLGRALLEESANQGVVAIPHRDRIHDKFDVERLCRSEPDAIINAAGIIPAYNKPSPDPDAMVITNSLIPGWLANETLRRGIPFLHVSTDCVFSGDTPGRRRNGDTPDPVDIYGITKRLGESLASANGSLVIRTSFIGLQHGLLRWLLDQPKGSTIPGFVNAYWSGSFVNEVARGLIRIITSQPNYGIRHLATQRSFSKYEVLHSLVEGLKLNLEVKPTEEPVIYRGLVPSLPYMMADVPSVMDEVVKKVKSSSR